MTGSTWYPKGQTPGLAHKLAFHKVRIGDATDSIRRIHMDAVAVSGLGWAVEHCINANSDGQRTALMGPQVVGMEGTVRDDG